MPLQDLLARFRDYGDDPAILAFGDDDCRVTTFADLYDRALRLAAGLREAGIAPGEPVAVMSRNSEAAVVVRLGILAAGAMLVSLDHELDPDMLEQQLGDSAPRLVFTNGDLAKAFAEAAGDSPAEIYLLDADPESESDGRSWDALFVQEPGELHRADPEEVVALFYTSGTTGRPKAVPLTHRNIESNIHAILDQGLIGRGDRILLPLPLYHSYPYIVGMLTPLAAGTAIVLPAGVLGPQITHALREGRVKTVVGVPRLYEALLKGIKGRTRDAGLLPAVVFRALLNLSLLIRRRTGRRVGRLLLRSLHKTLAPELRVLASGGAKLEADTEWQLEALGWEVLTGYGLVETASVATFNPRGEARVGSAGLPSPGTELRLVPQDERQDADREAAESGDSGGTAPPDADSGEIQFRGPIVFSGYRNNPDANAEAFTEDGWFRTGDLGRRDTDGYLYIVGRLKERIVLPGGKKLHPEEPEKVYSTSEYVGEIAVMERDGRLVGLVVPDAEALRKATSSRIEDLFRVSFSELSQQLPAYKRISDFVITREKLPRTHLGKYKRHELPEIYERAERGEKPPPPELSAADQALLEEPRAQELWRWLQERFPEQRLTPETSPQLDLGIDSLEWVNLSLEMEQRLGVRISEETIARTHNLRDLLREVVDAPADDAEARDARRAEQRRLLDDPERWLKPVGWSHRLAGGLLFGLAWLAGHALFRLRSRGRDKVPDRGPLVIVANHVSDLDPIVLAVALSYRRLQATYWGADRDRVFAHTVGRRFARIAHLFPVSDLAPDASLKMAAQVLARERILVWFPEEWRSPTGEIQRFLPGIGRILEQQRASVVPAYIEGTYEAMPRTRRLPRPHPVTVHFGEPIAPEALDRRVAERGDEETSRAQAIADALRDAVAALAPRGAPEGNSDDGGRHAPG